LCRPRRATLIPRSYASVHCREVLEEAAAFALRSAARIEKERAELQSAERASEENVEAETGEAHSPASEDEAEATPVAEPADRRIAGLDEAMRIVRESYARREISREEFLQIRDDLRE
jgi:hypothetical protein